MLPGETIRSGEVGGHGVNSWYIVWVKPTGLGAVKVVPNSEAWEHGNIHRGGFKTEEEAYDWCYQEGLVVEAEVLPL